MSCCATGLVLKARLAPRAATCSPRRPFDQSIGRDLSQGGSRGHASVVTSHPSVGEVRVTPRRGPICRSPSAGGTHVQHVLSFGTRTDEPASPTQRPGPVAKASASRGPSSGCFQTEAVRLLAAREPALSQSEDGWSLRSSSTRLRHRRAWSLAHGPMSPGWPGPALISRGLTKLSVPFLVIAARGPFVGQLGPGIVAQNCHGRSSPSVGPDEVRSDRSRRGASPGRGCRHASRLGLVLANSTSAALATRLTAKPMQPKAFASAAASCRDLGRGPCPPLIR